VDTLPVRTNTRTKGKQHYMQCFFGRKYEPVRRLRTKHTNGWCGRTPVHDSHYLIILDLSMTLLNKNGLSTHKNANMQATVITEPEKLTIHNSL